MNYKTLRFIALVLLTVLLTGCKNEPEDLIKESKIKEDKIQIGVTFESYVIERWQRDRDVFVSTANELGADVNVQTASGSLEKQIEQINYFIKKEMDVIVIIAADSNSLAEVVKTAQDKGIKIIAYDRLIRNADVDLYISIDSKKVGELMAQCMIDNIPEEGKISIVLGPQTDYNVMLLEQGIQSVLVTSNYDILNKNYAKNWLAEKGFSTVMETLSTNDSFDGIICGNDDLASHAIRALAESRMAGEVVVVGQDADLSACQRIVEGTQTMTVYKPIEKMASLAAENAIKLARGEEIIIKETTIDGRYKVPSIKLDPVAVTIENLDEVIIDSGFHVREEVYLNYTE